MVKFASLKLVIAVVAILTIAGVGYAGLLIWRNETLKDEQTVSPDVEAPLNNEVESIVELLTPQDQEVPQIDTSEGNYIPVELREVLNYWDVSKITYVKTSGEIVGFEYDPIGALILLSDNSNNYLVVTICHACVSNYFDLLSTLKNGDQVEVKGAAYTTTPKAANLKNRFDIVQALPERIGMVGLASIDGMRIATSDWKTYRNEAFGFEVQYPNSYRLENRHIRRPVSHSQSIILNKDRGDTRFSISLEIILSQQEREIQFHLGMTDRQYLNYIRDSSRYHRTGFVSVGGDKLASVFFFEGENPGELGDPNDTAVVVIEHKETIFVIKRVPATKLDAEFKTILATLRFTEN